MRLTITFFLVASILGLTYWAWTLTPSRLEYHPLAAADSSYEELKKIMNSTDIEFLRKQAIGTKIGEEATDRDRETIIAMNALGITVVFSIIALVPLFLEIAARGRNYQQQKL